MATTKADITLQSSTTNTAGSTATGTGVDLTDGYGAYVTAKITNGATGPTVGCDFVLDVSHDNTNWKEFSRVTAGTDNSGVYEWTVRIPIEVQHVRSVFTGNTGQSVTVECLGSEVSAVS